MAKRKTKRRSTTRGMPRKTARKAYAPKRRKRRNPKAGLSPADLRDLGSAAAGGIGAGIVTGYLDNNKPDMLKQVPTEIVAAGLGVALAAFGKTPMLKNLAAGMVSFAAGSYAKEITKPKVEGLFSPSVGALMYNNPMHHHDEIHVGALTFAVEE
jgi:hypothetical protein